MVLLGLHGLSSEQLSYDQSFFGSYFTRQIFSSASNFKKLYGDVSEHHPSEICLQERRQNITSEGHKSNSFSFLLDFIGRFTLRHFYSLCLDCAQLSLWHWHAVAAYTTGNCGFKWCAMLSSECIIISFTMFYKLLGELNNRKSLRLQKSIIFNKQYSILQRSNGHLIKS